MRYRFKHASADRAETDNLIVELRDEHGLNGYGEGCPRHYVTGETFESAERFHRDHSREIVDAVKDIQSLQAWITGHEALIDANPAAFCAMELAALDLLGKRHGASVETLIDLPDLASPVEYTAVMGNSSPVKTKIMSTAYRLWGFSDFKVKLSGDLARDRDRLNKLPKNARIRVDANNFWRDASDCIGHIQHLGHKIWAIEEPITAGDHTGMQAISQATDAKIILDESLYQRNQLEHYDKDAEYWIANIRVSKCGGVLRSIKLAREAEAMGIPIILGAHVGETSLLTRAALTVGQALARPPLGREGAYGNILLKQDISQPALRFGGSARLDPSRYGLAGKPGLGVMIKENMVTWLPTSGPGVTESNVS